MWYRPGMEKTTLYLPDELHGQIRSMARRTGRPQAELIREALSEYVGRNEQPWPKSIGIVSDGRLRAEEAKSWVRSEWSAAYERRRADRDRA